MSVPAFYCARPAVTGQQETVVARPGATADCQTADLKRAYSGLPSNVVQRDQVSGRIRDIVSRVVKCRPVGTLLRLKQAKQGIQYEFPFAAVLQRCSTETVHIIPMVRRIIAQVRSQRALQRPRVTDGR